MFYYPSNTPVKPLFLLVDMPKNPLQREQTKQNVKALLDALEEALWDKAPVGMPLWIMPYGEDTNWGPTQVREYDPLQLSDLTATAPAHLAHGFDYALYQLGDALSRNGALNYPGNPLSLPFVVLLGDPAFTNFTQAAMQKLEANPWFSATPHRWFLPRGQQIPANFARRFTGGRNAQVLPLPEKGGSLFWFSTSELMDALQEWVFSEAPVAIDSMEAPPPVRDLPPWEEMGPGIMVEPETPEPTAGYQVPAKDRQGDGLVHVDPVLSREESPFEEDVWYPPVEEISGLATMPEPRTESMEELVYEEYPPEGPADPWDPPIYLP